MKKMVLFIIVVLSLIPLSAVYFKIGDYDTPGSANSIFVSNNIVYVADGEPGLQIIDVSNPQNPSLLGSYDAPSYAYSVFVSNNIAYIADYDAGLQIIDVSNPQNPVLLGSYDTPGTALSVFVSNNIAYVADVSPGLQIIDFLYAHGYYHRFPDVAAWDAGLQIIDVSNPQNPALLGSYDTPVMHPLL